jgi:hypothetical protein
MVRKIDPDLNFKSLSGRKNLLPLYQQVRRQRERPSGRRRNPDVTGVGFDSWAVTIKAGSQGNFLNTVSRWHVPELLRSCVMWEYFPRTDIP